MTYNDNANEWLTPTEEEQAIRILKGECPHNQGWSFEAHGHNDSAYKCRLCGEIGWY